MPDSSIFRQVAALAGDTVRLLQQRLGVPSWTSIAHGRVALIDFPSAPLIRERLLELQCPHELAAEVERRYLAGVAKLEVELVRVQDAAAAQLPSGSRFKEANKLGTLRLYSARVQNLADSCVRLVAAWLAQQSQPSPSHPPGPPPPPDFQPRTSSPFTSLQLAQLHKAFSLKPQLNQAQKRQLAAVVGISERQVAVWFANQRQRRLARRSKSSSSGMPGSSASMAMAVPRTVPLPSSTYATPPPFAPRLPSSSSSYSSSGQGSIWDSPMRSAVSSATTVEGGGQEEEQEGGPCAVAASWAQRQQQEEEHQMPGAWMQQRDISTGFGAGEQEYGSFGLGGGGGVGAGWSSPDRQWSGHNEMMRSACPSPPSELLETLSQAFGGLSPLTMARGGQGGDYFAGMGVGQEERDPFLSPAYDHSSPAGGGLSLSMDQMVDPNSPEFWFASPSSLSPSSSFDTPSSSKHEEGAFDFSHLIPSHLKGLDTLHLAQEAEELLEMVQRLPDWDEEGERALRSSWVGLGVEEEEGGMLPSVQGGAAEGAGRGEFYLGLQPAGRA